MERSAIILSYIYIFRDMYHIIIDKIVDWISLIVLDDLNIIGRMASHHAFGRMVPFELFVSFIIIK